VFRRLEIWAIVYLTAVCALFSPLSANIYFPAIPVLATAFGQPVELINVTVTVYMLLQGVSPMLWGLADWHRCGSRLIYLSCLAQLCLSCVGLALTPTTDYWLLVPLRCAQAAGSASSVAITGACAGTIMDVAAPSERGTILAMASIGTLVAPCIGPVLGGVLAGNLGWHSIFWFLCICSGVVLVIEALLLPETLRTITVDGGAPAQRWDRPFVPLLGRGVKSDGEPEEPRGSNKPIANRKTFRNIDLCLAVVYGILTTMSTVFLAVMPSLTEIDLGLCYLAMGAGAIAGSVGSGKLVDWDFRHAQKRAREAPSGQVRRDRQCRADEAGPQPDLLGRIHVIGVGYGWAANQKAHIACLLVLQFLAMMQVTAIYTANQTLLMDRFPGRGVSVSASNNLVRCLTGAVLVSVV
ncbi:MFS general substrate transporter, partial [Calocera cornea HHB12733]